MPRILVLVLALIVAGVAFVLDHRIELYAVAAVLAGVAVVLFVKHAQAQARAQKRPYSTARPKPTLGHQDVPLESLGIGEVRTRAPKQAGGAPGALAPGTPPAPPEPPAPDTATPPDETTAEAPTSFSTPSSTPPADSDAAASPFAPPASSPPSLAVDALVPSAPSATPPAVIPTVEGRPIPELVARPLVQAALAALGTHTVALLRRIGTDQYAVDAIESLSGAASKRGCTFAPGVPLVQRGTAALAVEARTVGGDGFPRTALGYYRTAPPVRQLAYVPVQVDGVRYLLLADSIAPDAFADPSAQALLGQFARVLAALGGAGSDTVPVVAPSTSSSAPEPDADANPASGADAPEVGSAETDAPEPDAEVASAEPRTSRPRRSRREIIAEEMAAAREARTPLALVVMGLRASEVVEASGPATAKDALDRLTQRIYHLSPEVRVEPFGALLLGAFVRRDVDGVAEWAERLQEDVARQLGPLREGVSIGAAFMQPGQTDPQMLRDEATEALMEAHTGGDVVIFE